MKKIIALLLALVMIFSFAACSSTTEDEDDDEDTATEDTETSEDAEDEDTEAEDEVEEEAEAEEEVDYSDVKIAVMLPGSANDGGWSQMAAAAAEALLDIYPGCTVNYTESIEASDYETIMRGYADAGYSIIVAHGSQFLDTSQLIAVDYPDITFITTSVSESSVDESITNHSGINFGNYEGGFFCGVACALATEVGIIGVIGSNEIDAIMEWVEGVEDGAHYINPDLEIIVVYTGSQDDALIAKQCADALVEQGADIITQNADACGIGSVEECAELGIMNVGSINDYSTYGDTCFLSVVQDCEMGIEAAIAQAIEGTLESGFADMGAAAGVVYFTEYTGTYADVLTDDEKALLDDLLQQAIDGLDVSTLAA